MIRLSAIGVLAILLLLTTVNVPCLWSCLSIDRRSGHETMSCHEHESAPPAPAISAEDGCGQWIQFELAGFPVNIHDMSQVAREPVDAAPFLTARHSSNVVRMWDWRSASPPPLRSPLALRI